MANKYYHLSGGLDLETPPLEAKPGSCIETLNCFELVKGGYTTLEGYERFDGSAPPSTATYYRILLNNYGSLDAAGLLMVALGATLVAGTLSGTVIHTKASYDNTQLVVIISEPVGDTPLSSDLPMAFNGASLSEIDYFGDASTEWEESDSDMYLSLAQDARRASIDPLPGSGETIGVAQIGGDAFGWRGLSSESFCYKADSGTWVQIPYAHIYTADVAKSTFAVDEVDGNFTVLRSYDYVQDNGTIDPAKCCIVVKSDVGGTAATISGTAVTKVDWTPVSGGAVEYINHNFYGSFDTYSMYFADGVNCPMAYSPKYGVIQPITSNYRVPNEVIGSHVIAHNHRLFVSTGSTYLTSVAGEPTEFDGFLGAAEIGVGDVITGFAATSSENLSIFTRNQTHAVKGTSIDNWEKRILSENSGALNGCIAQIDDVFSSDDRGITKLSRTETVGGFDAGTITDDVQSLFRNIDEVATCATTFRKLNQMRFYYGEQFLMLSRVLYNANGNEGVRYGITEGIYPVPVLRVSTEEDATGIERTLFGSEDGYVYHMDSGTSFDGEEMEFICSLHYNHVNQPLLRKRFVGIEVEGRSNGAATVDCYYYMNDGNKTFNPRTLGFPGSPATFDVSAWNGAVFDDVPLVRPRMKLRGTGYNLQLSFYRKSAHQPQLTLTGYTLRFKQRGLVPL